MIPIIIPLKHIILDPAKPIDLSALSEQAAVDLIRESYGFLSPAIDVSISNGIATIALQEQRADKINDALKFYPKFQPGDRSHSAACRCAPKSRDGPPGDRQRF
jgi:hypothetical protein